MQSNLELDLSNQQCESLEANMNSVDVIKRPTHTVPPLIEEMKPLEVFPTPMPSPRRPMAEIRPKSSDHPSLKRRHSEFMGILAHELKTPLTKLILSLQLLDPSQDEASFIQSRRMAERQVKYMARLIEDMANFSQLKRGDFTLKKERGALAEILEHAIDTCQPILSANQIKVLIQGVTDEIQLWVDHTRIAQVLINILSNAAKHSPLGGNIRIFVEQLGERVTIRIQDEGDGIHPRLLPDKLFKLYRCGVSAQGKNKAGCGIGMYVAKKIIILHGGEISAESAGRGKGSSFIINLPLAKEV